MPLELIWEEVGVIRRFHGTVTTQDIKDSIEHVHADVRFSTLQYSINDFLGVTGIDVSKAALANAALRTIGASKTNESVRVAIVATAPDVRALAAFYSSPAYMPYQSQLFDTVAQARLWITQP